MADAGQVYWVPSLILIRENTCVLTIRCSRCEVTVKSATTIRNMMTDEGVMGVLFISKSLKFMKDSTKPTASDKFIALSSLSFH